MLDSALFESGSEAALRVRAALSQMEVAEEELRRAFRSKDREPEGLFLRLHPRAEFRFWSRSAMVYRAHARELCRRARAGADLSPATDAECLLALSDMSLRCPLNSTGTALYERLFVAVTGRRVAGEAAREPWTGACEEFLGVMRRKLRDRSR